MNSEMQQILWQRLRRRLQIPRLTLKLGENPQPISYTQEELLAVATHIDTNFGSCSTMFEELYSPDLRIDIGVIPPADDWPYISLITLGMGAMRMDLSEDPEAEADLKRAELMVRLPPDWKLDDEHLKDENWYWPIRLLKALSRFPLHEDCCLTSGYSVDFDEPLAPNTRLSAALIASVTHGARCRLPSGEIVNFYQVLPLYPEEVKYREAFGEDAFFDRIKNISAVIDPKRPSLVNKNELPQQPLPGTPELYTQGERTVVEAHIHEYLGDTPIIFREVSSPDIRVDICVVPPSLERPYFTLITVGMGAHRMKVSKEFKDYNLERAELAIALPTYWRLNEQDFKDERWYWPVRLLRVLARQPIAENGWLGVEHSFDQDEPFAPDTKLCAAIIIPLQGSEKGKSWVCTLPNGELVNFYQVLPLYREELNYANARGAGALFEKMQGKSFIVTPKRPNIFKKTHQKRR